VKGLPVARGTGFFISADGWFITAAHVVFDGAAVRRVDMKACADELGEREADVRNALLEKESRLGVPPVSFSHLTLMHVNLDADIALLKADLDANKSALEARGHQEFPHLRVSRRTLDEGEPVYAFGYPLPSMDVSRPAACVLVGSSSICPRATSAIVSSTIERTGLMSEAVNRPPERYVLDRALNYGNSGGPIVAVETGCVHAVCSRFQPVRIPQSEHEDEHVMIPSLYGVVSSLGRQDVLEALVKQGVLVEDI